MEFEHDHEKSEANLRQRGFDFEFAASIFDGPTLEKEDRRRNYGERRMIAVGLTQGIVLTVVYTDRRIGPASVVRRIISARRSNRGERKAYERIL